MPQRGNLVQPAPQAQALRRQQQAKEQAPEEEIPPCPVPQAHQEPHQQQAAGPFSPRRPDQRPVQMIPKPPAQGDVPPPPEIGQRPGGQGPAEILRQVKAQQLSHPQGHVGVPGEIKVQGQHQRQGIEPAEGQGPLLPFLETLAEPPQRLGQDALFPQAHHQPPQALRPFGQRAGPAVQLPGQGSIGHHGAGQHPGKSHEIQRHGEAPLPGGYGPPPDPQNIGRALQGVKANAHRAGQLHQGHRQPGGRPKFPPEKAQVAKDKQQPQTHPQGEDQNPFGRRPAPHPLDQPAAHPAVDRAGRQQEQKKALHPAIKHQAGCQEDPIAPLGGHQKIHRKDNGQKVI